MSRLVNKALPDLFNGVSQQDPTLRLDNQLTEQVNFMGTLTDGLYTRPPSEFIKRLTTQASEESLVHHINRDTYERYFMVVNNGSIEVFDIAGNSQVVKYGHVDINSPDYTFTPNDWAIEYIQGIKPKEDIRCLTVKDFTFILNRKVATAMLEPVTNEGGFENSNGALSEGRVDSTVQQFSDLSDPDYTPVDAGSLVKVEGNPEESYKSYYLVHKGDNVYEETVKPGTHIQLDSSTMVHGLVRLPDGSFGFTRFYWEPRHVGDDVTNPIPSFIGAPLNNLTLYRNRLTFLSQDNVISSKAGFFWDFWITSVPDVLDDDMIDLNASSHSVSDLHKMVGHGRNLLLFSDLQQLTFHSGDNSLTTKNVKIDPTTRYETSAKSEVATAGSVVFFVSPRGHWANILEYYIQPTTLIEDASNITGHCPEYIPDGFITLETIPVLDMMILSTSGDPTSLYFYRYYWVGEKKAQSSWSRWEFSGTLLGTGVIGTKLYYLMKQLDGSICLNVVELERKDTTGKDSRVQLDQQVVLTSTGGQLNVPYGASEIVVLETDGAPIGTPYSLRDGHTVTLDAPDGSPFLVGIPYEGYFTLSPWYLKDRQSKSVLEGRLQIRSVTLSYKDSGDFQVDVRNPGRPQRSTIITNKQTRSGTTRVSVLGRNDTTNITVRSNDHRTLNITGVSYEATYSQRASIL